MKILIGEISSYKAIVIARFLKKNYKDVVIIGFDYKACFNKIHTKYCDEFYFLTNSPHEKKLNIAPIKSLIEEKQVDIFIPVNSWIYNDCIEFKSFLGKAFAYIGDSDSYKTLNNKDLLYNAFSSKGIQMPRNFDTIEEATLPFVVKPTNQTSSKGVKYIYTEKEKVSIKNANFTNRIIQQYVKGCGCGYSVFAVEGNIVVGFGHKRMAEYPAVGGSSVYRTNYQDDRMKRVAAYIVKELKWSGFAMFEFKLTPANELYLIEVNPRIWGSINQGLQNGVNYFEPLLGKAEMPHGDVKQQNTYLSPLLYMAFMQYVRHFKFKPIIYFIRNLRISKPDVSLCNDPNGYISVLLRKFI